MVGHTEESPRKRAFLRLQVWAIARRDDARARARPQAAGSLDMRVSGVPLPAGALGAPGTMGPEASWRAALFRIVGDIKKEGAARPGDPLLC